MFAAVPLEVHTGQNVDYTFGPDNGGHATNSLAGSIRRPPRSPRSCSLVDMVEVTEDQRYGRGVTFNPSFISLSEILLAMNLPVFVYRFRHICVTMRLLRCANKTFCPSRSLVEILSHSRAWPKRGRETEGSLSTVAPVRDPAPDVCDVDSKPRALPPASSSKPSRSRSSHSPPVPTTQRTPRDQANVRGTPIFNTYPGPSVRVLPTEVWG